MLGLVQGTSGDVSKSLVVRCSKATCALSNVGTNAISRSDNLHPDCASFEMIPLGDYGPNPVRHSFRELIHSQIFKIGFLHFLDEANQERTS